MRTPKALLAWWGVLLIILGVGYAHGFLLPPGGRLNAHSGGAASIQRRLASTPTRCVR